MKTALPKIAGGSEKIKTFMQKLFQDKYDKILEDLLELENENPQDMRVKQKIAEIHFKKERIDEAIAKYKEIAEYHEKNNFSLKAINSYKNILKIKPGLVEFNLRLASLYEKLGMIVEAANQCRIAVNHYAALGNSERTIQISQRLVKLDPSLENRDKLAEIYKSFGMAEEAIKQYEILAKVYRQKKDYSKLLYYDELILPHQPQNRTIVRDVCILHLRNKRPERALKILDQHNLTNDPWFKELVAKARRMQEILRKGKG